MNAETKIQADATRATVARVAADAVAETLAPPLICLPASSPRKNGEKFDFIDDFANHQRRSFEPPVRQCPSPRHNGEKVAAPLIEQGGRMRGSTAASFDAQRLKQQTVRPPAERPMRAGALRDTAGRSSPPAPPCRGR